jgi:endonuclease/exonuclease/phosphatase family metal-dependent hydrolase
VRRAGGTVALAVLLLAAALAGCDGSDGNDDGADATTQPRVTVVSQNLLHGIACAEATDRCRLPQRVELFARQLAEADCPQVVALQEIDPVMVGLLRDETAEVCDGDYELVGGDDPSVDREVVLTTLPVLGQERVRLAGPLRTALWVRMRAAVGPLDVVATHLASGSDNRPCDSDTCPPPCQSDDSLNTCQGRQAVELLEDRRSPRSVGVLLGDLNAQPGEPTIEAIEAADYVDTFIAAGNAECDEATGTGCTGGREDADLSDLTSPGSRQSSRIDYVFLATDRDCTIEEPTGLFAAEPADPPLDDLVFAADHTGVQATISCVTGADDTAAAQATVPTTTTTAGTDTAVDAETAAAITTAFETVFNGGGELETRLGSLQDAARLRESFVARFEDPATKTIVDQVQVRIDSMQQVDANHVDVVYSILLDQAAVLDHSQGEAVREDGEWLVSRRAYCNVATLGLTTVPEPCR